MRRPALPARRWLLTAIAAVAIGACAWGAWWYFRPGGPAVTPDRSRYPVRGVDISAHNGAVDFGRLVSEDSIDFAIIKATEGTSFKDAAFPANWRAARAAGLRVGAYHFFRFDTSGYMQALNLLHSVRGRHLDLPLVIDIEEWTNPDNHTTRSIIDQLTDMIDTLEEAGYRVMLYSNRDGYERFIQGHFDRYPLWIASLRGEPALDEWALWQYTHRGSLEGADGSIDINTFSGDRQAWEEWLAAQSDDGAV